MSVDPQYIQIGMRVRGVDDEDIGWVKEIRASDILVDRMLARDLYVPLEAILAIVDASATSAYYPHVVLKIPKDRVGDMGWPHPD